MASLNFCTFIGRLGQNPKITNYDGGRKLAQFSIACDSPVKQKDGTDGKRTEWINIVIWQMNPDKGLVSVAEQYLKKGSLVCVVGELRNRQYDAQDGTKRYVTEVYAEKLRMLDSRQSAAPAPPLPDGTQPGAQTTAGSYAPTQSPAQAPTAQPATQPVSPEMQQAVDTLGNLFGAEQIPPAGPAFDEWDEDWKQ